MSRVDFKFILSILAISTLLCAVTKYSHAQISVVSNTSNLSCPVINTKLGYISGVQQQTVLGNGTFCSYKGIRFGEAPIGKLRFKVCKIIIHIDAASVIWIKIILIEMQTPVKSKQWQGVYNASEYGAACIQQASTYAAVSEDCLFLNVFVPSPSICGNTRDIPVIVFIYGGSFEYGAGYDDLYGPHRILNKCVIFVTFNYRVGAFGFLALALDEYSGNMGMKDQQLAMEWTNEHISSFGGNPKQITLMGQSAGAASVCLHRLNQISRNWFKQAYAISSSGLNYYSVLETNNKTALIVELAKNQSVNIENTEQLIQYIQTVDAEYILNNTLSPVDIYILEIEPTWSPCIER